MVDPAELTDDFHIILPVIANTNSNFLYVAMIGSYDSDSRLHMYDYMLYQTMTAYSLPSTQTDEYISLRGQAGSL